MKSFMDEEDINFSKENKDIIFRFVVDINLPETAPLKRDSFPNEIPDAYLIIHRLFAIFLGNRKLRKRSFII